MEKYELKQLTQFLAVFFFSKLKQCKLVKKIFSVSSS